ncbi:unnamed protein product, partial [Laminaria digitata]
MYEAEDGRYQRARARHAKRLAAEYLSQLEATEKKRPSDADAARLEQERVAALVAERRQREAALVGKFDSDEIYNLEDENGLAMRQAQRESRCRVRALCEGRKLADTTGLITDDLIRELQTFLTSCLVYVGFVRPGQNAADIVCPWRGNNASISKNTLISLRRNGEVHDDQNISAKTAAKGPPSCSAATRADVDRRRDIAKLGEDRCHWECTSIGNGYSPNPDIVFKCVDAGLAAVVGAAVERRERRLGDTAVSDLPAPTEGSGEPRNENAKGDDGKVQLQATPSKACRHEEENKREDLIQPERYVDDNNTLDDTGISSGGNDADDDDNLQTSSSSDLSRRNNNNSNEQPPQTVDAAKNSRKTGLALDPAARPQVCVPLTGVGDSGCIGMVGVQGFGTGAVVDDEDWRDWFAARMTPLRKGEHRAVKRLKLVRPRVLPTKGRLESVPSGTAARVVYGSVEKVSSKRGMPVYTVRWEDGLLQCDIPRKHMREVVAEDDVSAGKGALLTPDVVHHLAWIGKTVGPVLDEVRKAVHLAKLRKVTLDANAHHRDVIELALSSLVECIPSIDAAEVWQLDSSGSIRCTHGLVAGGDFYRPNQRVDGLFDDEEELEEFRRLMEPEPNIDTVVDKKKAWRTGEGCGPKRRHEATNLEAECNIRDGLVITPRRTPGVVLGAPFSDYCFKVGRLWIGADRLARGFALVLRSNGSSGQGTSAAAAASENVAAGVLASRGTRSPRKKRTQDTGPLPAAAAAKAAAAAAAAAGGRGGGSCGNLENGVFAARVAKEVGVALACVRGRERTAAARALALKNLSVVCSDSTVSGRNAQSKVLEAISAVLPGCRAYIGVLQPGGDALLYESATVNSRMRGRVLHRGEGISFTCLDHPDERIRVIHYRESMTSETKGPPQPRSLLEAGGKVGGEECQLSKIVVGDAVRVWYASSWLSATVLRDRGHQCYDVRYDNFKETEAGVPRWRLQEIVTSDHLNVKVDWSWSSSSSPKDATDNVHQTKANNNRDDEESWPWPFVCVPLRGGGSNRVGVLGVDGWSGVQLENPQGVHPEKAVFGFLEEAGSLLAAALYKEKRNRGLSIVGKAVRGKDATQISSLEALIVLLRETVTFRRRVDVLETRAAEPGAVYCLGNWESSARREDLGDGGGRGSRNRRQKPNQNPVRVFGEGLAPRVPELCITPAQLNRVSARRGEPPAPPSTKQRSLLLKELTPYQREIHCIAKYGAGLATGLQATTLSTRPGEVVGRFQRLLVRPGGGRPSADGWYLVRVARTLPETTPQVKQKQRDSSSSSTEFSKKGVTSTTTAATSGSSSNRTAVKSEDGDVSLLSELCRRLEVGFMAIASRQQRALLRTKALDRVLACCEGFPGALTTTMMMVSSSSSPVLSAGVARESGAAVDGYNKLPHVSKMIGSGNRSENRSENRSYNRSKNRRSENRSENRSDNRSEKRSENRSENGFENCGRSPIRTTAGKPASGSGTVTVAAERRSKLSSASATAAGGGGSGEATEAGKDIVFSVPVQPPTAAETIDGRKGVLVSLKDGRLAVLVRQTEKSLAVVELPRGKQQSLPEKEV